MAKYSTEVKAVIVARILASWRANRNATISIDYDNYITFFPFLPIKHRFLEGDKPIFIVVDREESLRMVKEEYSFNG
jgi:hypothetical protein